MGYELHITRKEEWSDENGPEISAAEWKAVVRADPEMQVEYRYPGGRVVSDESKGDTIWIVGNEDRACFYFHNGNVVAKSPDREIVQKMWSLAQGLAARVQGDDGEFYDASGNPLPPALVQRSWWRFWGD